MRVVYVNPPYGENFVRSARWAAKSRGRVQRHPEQALIHIAVLEEAGHKCKFIEGAACNMTEEQVLKEIKKFKPDLAIIHTTTPSIYNDIEYAKNAKKMTGCKTVMVGAHASAVPDDTLKKAKGAVDAVARGEIEYTLRDIANGTPLKDVLGIVYQSKGKIVHNQPRPLLDVNELPFPSWKHIDPHWYHDAGKLFPFLTLYTGRGCFGLCTFCRETQVINGRALRMRDAKKVVDEMEYDLKLYPDLKEIMFETDTFTAIPKHTKDVCNEIIKRGLNKKISWSCNVRVDIKLELLPLMKEAGCRMLMIGYEFGTQKQLNAVKKQTTPEMGRKFSEEANRLGFILHGCFMIGAPGETKESAQATIDFAKSLPLDTIQVSGIAVYPGTALYDWAKKNDYITAKDWKDWVDENHEQVTLLSYPQMSKAEIDFYIDKALREFYLRPKQMWKMATNIRNIGDIVRKFYGLKMFLDYFKKNKREAKA
ncbi:MAG: radical SAM protein [bacterium]|nr:radical SAM protein [bacterium]